MSKQPSLRYFRVVRFKKGGPRRLFRQAVKLVALPVARAWRQRLRETTFIGVTGSAGKTTAKRLLLEVLSVHAPTTANRGSSNRAKSVTKVLKQTRRWHGFCVQEFGASDPGSLQELIWTFEPDVALVTTVGLEHLSAFKTREAIAEEKASLVAALPPEGLAVLNADDPLVRGMAALARCRIVLYGISPDAEVRAEDVRSAWPERLSFTLVAGGSRFPVTTMLNGTHWLPSALGALATAISLGVPAEKAVAAVAGVTPENHRLSVWERPGRPTFLLDDWKAPVWTVVPSLAVLGTARAGRRVAVIGQLSDDARKPRRLYAAVAREAREQADLVVFVGRWAHHAVRARTGEDDASIVAFERFTEASDFLRDELRPDDVVLIKATVVPDHLTRLAIERELVVDCRRNSCSRNMGCDRCSLISGRGLVKRARRHLVRPWREPGGSRELSPEAPSSAGTPAT